MISDAWANDLIDLLRTLPGGGGADELVASWERHAARPSPVVTVFGAYNTGKSSLLKRFLVDDGRNVPEWLIVKASKTTFEVNETEAFGCVLRDTPGIAGGAAAHDAQAQEALALSDGFFVTLMPQLLTADKDHVLALLSGRLFREGGLGWPASAVRIVVGRIDAMGVDASYDPEEFAQLILRKKAELLSLLASAGLDPSSFEIHFVAADPDGAIGNSEASRRSYDSGRAWDSVAALEASLAATSATLATLRCAAHHRFLCLAGNQAMIDIDGEIRREQVAWAEARTVSERGQLVLAELNALVKAARDELEGVVHEELFSVRRGAFGGGKEFEEQLRSRVVDALERWANRHDHQLERLAAELGADLKLRSSRPGSAALRDFFDGIGAGDSAPSSKSRTIPNLKRSADILRAGVEAAHQIHIRMPIADARKELRRLAKVEDAALHFSRKSGFANEVQRTAAARYVAAYDGLAAALPVILDFGSIVLDERRERQGERARAERRERLRTEVETTARRMAQIYFDGDRERDVEGWSSGANDLRGQIHRHFATYTAIASSIGVVLAQLEEQRKQLAALLTR